MTRLLGILLILIPPALGAWLASSLTAYLGGPPGLALFAGLLLFPILPVAWQLSSAASRKPAPPPSSSSSSSPKRRGLSAFTRLVLRTHAVNLAFLAVMCALFPHKAFPALAVRGDWMLDGKSGAAVDVARTVLHGAARGLEWLYALTQDDEYAKFHVDEPLPPDPKPQEPQEPPAPTPTPTPTPPPVVDEAQWPLPARLHPAVLALTPADETSPAAVALFLRGHTKKGADRVHALHDYVADRIVYDVDSYHRGVFPPQDAATVFRTRKAVCAGYAALLKTLGDLAGEKIVYLHGDAKGARIESHAWNAAQLDDGWALIDATWDAGFINEQGVFEKHFDTAFLFAPAKFFVATHLPSDKKWQLLAEPVDRGAFLRMPNLRPDFYRAGLVLVSPQRAQVDAAAGGAVDVVVENPRGALVDADVCPKGGGTCGKCTGGGAGATRLTCPLDGGGQWRVRLYASPDPNAKWIPGAFDLDVNAR